jgi:electron-transferring-flavoprotein dehydrogenase
VQENFARGMELHARLTVFAEGARGSLTKTLFDRFKLREGVDPQHFAIGVKEVSVVQ